MIFFEIKYKFCDMIVDNKVTYLVFMVWLFIM